MIQQIEPIARLSAQLARLPGVGSKTAQRLCYFLLDAPDSQATELANAILDAKRDVLTCPVCGGYTDVTPCALCADTARDRSILCVVRDAKDVLAMERTREYRGLYHVLQGVISPMDGVGPDDIRIPALLKRLEEGNVKEVILATNPDVEGEATASYISRLLHDRGVKVTRIAHGIPIGGNLEYTDEVTLAKALSGRREM
ncbi:MAG: recombination mediator RecR [Eubacteriales bacterium]|nr:recombination mediator RecR [Eubacteriales bacterium]